jgi:DNA-binding HxlR family transcriptional regulator
MTCPIRTTLDELAGRWNMLVIWYLRDQTLRYGEIRRSIPEISERMLARTLRELETADLVDRRAYPEVPPRVEYSLTERGRSLAPIPG